MDEETLNIEIRKFLKKVGVSAQREMENAVRDAVAKGKLGGGQKLAVKMTLEIPQLGVVKAISDEIALGGIRISKALFLPFFLKREDTAGAVSCQSRAILSGIGELSGYSSARSARFLGRLGGARKGYS
ncbi:MAG: DUF6494 family protein, partial [Methylocella sp.]